MKKVNIPQGYNTVMPYLIVADAEGLMDFLKKVFDAVEKMVVPADNGKIMHAEVTIGDSCIMLANSTEEFSVQNAGLYIHVADVDATYDAAIKAGGTSIMPPDDKEYGRSSGVKDPWGNTWWITTS